MTTQPRTKIIATLGPASDKPATIRAMVRAGMDMARLNFSHGTLAHHKLLAMRTRAAARTLKRSVKIIGDLQGPRVRVGKLNNPISVKRGEAVVLSQSNIKYQISNIPIDDPTLCRDLKPGDRIEIANGTIELRVTKIVGHDIHARVVRGGTITSGRGIDVPGRSLSLPALTEKDRRDIKLGVALKVDYINVSFVKSPKDIELARRLVRAAGGRTTKIMAKIETREAVHNITSILKVADAIMIGRGDLGFAFPPERLPVIQKDLIRAARKIGTPAVVATQMLSSMVDHRDPTRAELSDIANAVIDRVYAVTLSEETAIGNYPVRAVHIMDKVIRATESSSYDN